MYLIGAGGHAKVIIDILQSNKIGVDGIFDSNPDCNNLFGIPFLGSENGKSFLPGSVIISIGDNIIRKKIADKIDVIFGCAIHSSAIISNFSTILDGVVIAHGTIIQADSIIKRHVIVNTSASIDHDCIIEDFVHISPGAVLCGNVKIGEGTHIGAGAVCLPGVKIGKWCTVGAGAVVKDNLPDCVTAVGIPAHIIKNNNQ